MSDPNAETGTQTPADPDLHPSTAGWVAPAAPGRPAPAVASGAPTLAAPATHAVSTPGPSAPEHGTRSDSTENMDEPRGSLPQLPPIPGYDVQRFIGRGGMGLVYQAIHLATGRRVAIKLVNPSGAQDHIARERFAREVHTLATLKHPNIIPVYDAGDWHGFPYCAMEYVPGGTLSQHLERIRADLRAAINLLAKVARAVAMMHAAGVLHRDLKPLNILLGPDDEPMVADFGLARWEGDDSDLTDTGLPVGTRQYMAPEQTLGRRTDYTPACDVWALGVTLYEVLTGERPFNDDGVTDLYIRIRLEDPPAIASLAPQVPTELQAVALKCLAKRPEERYASAAAVAEELERWLAGEAVIATLPAPARPVVLPPPSRKPARRFRVVLAAVAVALVTVAAAWASGAFRDRKPDVEESEPIKPEPKKTLAERVAAGERVKLTDDKGVPLFPWTPTQGQEVAERTVDGYRWFSSHGPGVVGLAEDNWPLPLRVEGEVAVAFQTNSNTFGAVYAGERVWVGPSQHHTVVAAGITPRLNNKTEPFTREMRCREDLFFWERGTGASPATFDEKLSPWDRGAKTDDIRFVPVVIEVREKEVRTSVDGHSLKPVTEQMALTELGFKSGERPRFPQAVVTPPVFGPGIGIILQNANCCVRNLTVSKP